jgi:spectrin beta
MENYILLCNYNHESQELEAWINDQLQIAISEDYGQDYEHLKDLKSKFEEFKQNVKTGSERFVLCEQTADNLLKRSPPFARDILKRQEKLRSVWALLLDYMESRGRKLDVAEELHKFNRDVEEMHERLATKRNALPNELGRDTKQVHNLFLKHEVFENEVKYFLSHGVPKLRKVEAKIKIKKQYRQSTQLAERFKTSTVSWEVFDFTHGRVAKALGINS